MLHTRAATDIRSGDLVFLDAEGCARPCYPGELLGVSIAETKIGDPVRTFDDIDSIYEAMLRHGHR
jgi:hypothetical protein